MDSIEKTIVKGRLPDGKAVSIYGDASDQSVRGNIWIIFHEDAGDRLSFISKEGLNISIVNKDKESLIFSVHFEKDFGDVVFDENRTPVVEMDYATLIDSNEWILSDEGNFYSFVLTNQR
ncbi:MAG: hypothetical protein JKY92_01500 [Magnetovibrio sp.]|nr:hypothetical protein [Magnetovibrio sp.]